MDPTQAFRDLLFALLDLQDGSEAPDCARTDAADAAENLADWLNRGGFAPDARAVLRLVATEYRRKTLKLRRAKTDRPG